MVQLLYGTGNEAKLETMKRRLLPLNIQLIGLKDLKMQGFSIPVVAETGKSPLENARLKAKVYFETFHMPVFSCDTGLYFDNVLEQYQPGIYVRHINGRCLSDEEMVAYYSGLAKQFGPLTARYKNAVCLYLDENHIYESMDESLSGKPFLLMPHPRDGVRSPGFPLDSLSVQIESGMYYYDLEGFSLDEVAMDDGFCRFFRECLKN